MKLVEKIFIVLCFVFLGLCFVTILSLHFDIFPKKEQAYSKSSYSIEDEVTQIKELLELEATLKK